MTYAFKDKDGGVELYKRGQIIVVILSGACGTRVIGYYAEKLKKLAQTYNGQPWAYLCDSKDFQATTPEAQQSIVKTYKICMKLGCCFDAYCYDSAVGKAQTQKIMQGGGNQNLIEKVLFENAQLAEAYLLKRLAKLNGKTKEIKNTSGSKAC